MRGKKESAERLHRQGERDASAPRNCFEIFARRAGISSPTKPTRPAEGRGLRHGDAFLRKFDDAALRVAEIGIGTDGGNDDAAAAKLSENRFGLLQHQVE